MNTKINLQKVYEERVKPSLSASEQTVMEQVLADVTAGKVRCPYPAPCEPAPAGTV